MNSWRINSWRINSWRINSWLMKSCDSWLECGLTGTFALLAAGRSLWWATLKPTFKARNGQVVILPIMPLSPPFSHIVTHRRRVDYSVTHFDSVWQGTYSAGSTSYSFDSVLIRQRTYLIGRLFNRALRCDPQWPCSWSGWRSYLQAVGTHFERTAETAYVPLQLAPEKSVQVAC